MDWIDDPEAALVAPASPSEPEDTRFRAATRIAGATIGGGAGGAAAGAVGGLVLGLAVRGPGSDDQRGPAKLAAGAAVVGGTAGAVAGIVVGCRREASPSLPSVLAGLAALALPAGVGLLTADLAEPFDGRRAWAGAAVGAVAMPIVAGVVGAPRPR